MLYDMFKTCLFKTLFNEVSVETFQEVVASELHAEFQLKLASTILISFPLSLIFLHNICLVSIRFVLKER